MGCSPPPGYESDSDEEELTDEQKIHPNPDKILNGLNESNKVQDIKSVFNVLDSLGQGASGVVLLVEDIKTNEQYALKSMIQNQTFAKVRFAREMEILDDLKKCEYIVTLHDGYVDKKNYYIAQQYCTGGPLLGMYFITSCLI